MKQVSGAAKSNKNSAYIKVVNTQGKYKHIIMRSDNPGWV